MGRVYAATALREAPGVPADSRVALKVVHPHLLFEPGYVDRFLHEAEVGRRVRHPNVVRTFDADSIELDGETVQFLVMEFVEGRNLREILEDAGPASEPILREIALQAASGLAAIHEHKIVHRDLKPENILITAHHEVRIMDLGVARMLEATLTASSGAQFAGSMLYGAPEQFRGDLVGPCADLYSLGATLYELASGINPFLRENFVSVMQAHLGDPPMALRHRNPDFSPFFSALVSKLLSKHPADRFASAVELQRVLGKAERSAWWIETEPTLARSPDARPQIPVHRVTELTGREDALATIRAAWEAAKQGDGSVVLIEGEAGIGKSRVLDEVVQGLPDERLHVLYGSYAPAGGLGGISSAIVAKFGEPGLASMLAPHLDETPSLVGSFANLITQRRPALRSPRLSWEAYKSACVQLMRSLAKERPLIWMVDDLHFAPRESLDAIRDMARAAQGRRALFVLTTRPGLPPEERRQFDRMENLHSVTLHRLGARDVVEVLRGALGSKALAQRLAGPIAYQSDGVPLFIFEMLRTLKQRQLIQLLPDGTFVQSGAIADLEVPAAIEDIIQGRLERLDREQRAIVDVGAIAGLRFEPALVAGVLGMKKVHVLQEIARIEQQTGLIRSKVGVVEFDQHQIQEVLYRSVIPDLRREYHKLIAEAFASQLTAAPADSESAFLATHHLRGSDPTRGLQYLTDALDHLTATYRHEALIKLVDRAMEFAGELGVAERVDLLLRKASRLGTLGRRTDEYAALEEAAAIVRTSGDGELNAKVRLAEARFLLDTSRLGEAIDAARDVLQFDVGPDFAREASSILGRALLHLGQFEDARPHLERRMELARELGGRAHRSAARGDLGILEKSLGHYPEARAHFERQLELARERGDRHAEASACGNLGLASKLVGEFPEAIEYLQRCRRLSRDVGDRMGESSAAGNLGLVLKHLGRLDEAAEQFEESIEISREIGNRLGEARASGHLGLVAKAHGQLDRAREMFERCRNISRELGDRHGEVIAAGNLGNLQFDLGKFEQALAHFRAWSSSARDSGDRQGEVVALGNVGNALGALGRPAEALECFRETHRVAREIGDREGEAIALADAGEVLSGVGAFEGAMEQLEPALAIARELGVPRSEAFILQELGRVAQQNGNLDRARQRLEEARAIYESIGYPLGIAEAELALGTLDESTKDGRMHLERAWEIAHPLDVPSVFVPSACHLERPDAAQLLTAHCSRMTVAAQIDARLRLWQSSNDRAQLEAAHALLSALAERAAPEHRKSLLQRVPAHRAVIEALQA